jgi:hypothetical protein
MAHENESPAPARQQGRGSNNQHAPAAQGMSKQNTGGRKAKNKNTQQSELKAKLECVRGVLPLSWSLMVVADVVDVSCMDS